MNTRLLALSLACLSAPIAVRAQGASDEALIRAARDRSNRAIAAHDTAALAKEWLPEFQMVSSTNAQSNGREAARTRFAEIFTDRPDVVYVREPVAITVNAQWGQAAERGRWTGRWTQRDGATRVGGEYFAKWKKVDGRWLLLAETFVQTSCSGSGYCNATPAAGVATTRTVGLRAPVNGVVFVDANRNGIRDRDEAGLAGVAVSNQDAVVATASSGEFHLPRGGTGVVFVSVPDGYRAEGPFWRAVVDSTKSLVFAVTAAPSADEFSFVHASDTHIAPASVERTRRLRTLVDSLHPAFALITGDLVRDALRVSDAEATGYYELFMRETARFTTPMYTVPGNHENFGIERQLSLVSPTHPLYGRGMYRHYLGPDYYSFNYGGVHFVGLNTADITDLWYYGHVDSLQLAWLERDLALVPANVPVVTFDHIPFFSSFEGLRGYTDDPPAPTLITVNGRTVFRHTVSNAAEVLAVLRKHKHVLALGGHIHAVEKIEYEVEGLRTRFNQTSAVVGPTPASPFRFPSGITLYTVRRGEIDAGRFILLGAADPIRP
jgi:ketosteroid isomerase-like protein